MEDWFTVEPLAPDTWAISEYRHWEETHCYLLAGSLLGFVHVSLVAAVTAGACAGFLVWNFYPAKVFMGDTGSMFFGGIVTALALDCSDPSWCSFSALSTSGTR